MDSHGRQEKGVEDERRGEESGSGKSKRKHKQKKARFPSPGSKRRNEQDILLQRRNSDPFALHLSSAPDLSTGVAVRLVSGGPCTHHHHKLKVPCREHSWWATNTEDGHHHHRRGVGHGLPQHSGMDRWATSSEMDSRGIWHHHHRFVQTS